MTKYLFVASILLSLVGCQTMPYQPYARDVKKTPQQGGVIALKTEHRDEDRAKAEMMMKKNCGDLSVKIKEEGEVVVGQTTSGSSKETKDNGAAGIKLGSLFGMPVTSGSEDPSKNTATSSSTTNINEWQISYECATGKTSKKR